ncbi:30S ribosomal protein S8 [Patescibacteria group bacterium]|nr:30S ribosomal protein S8 [Patescibacteria group bacterium]
MMTDPISDMLSRIRNAAAARRQTVELPLSKIKYAIAKILENEGYLASVEQYQDGNRPMMRLKLKYNNDGNAISTIKRISKPSRRMYVKSNEMPRVRSGFGIAIISTPNGLMTNIEAGKRRLGGEVICEVF